MAANDKNKVATLRECRKTLIPGCSKRSRMRDAQLSLFVFVVRVRKTPTSTRNEHDIREAIECTLRRYSGRSAGEPFSTACEPLDGKFNIEPLGEKLQTQSEIGRNIKKLAQIV